MANTVHFARSQPSCMYAMIFKHTSCNNTYQRVTTGNEHSHNSQSIDSACPEVYNPCPLPLRAQAPPAPLALPCPAPLPLPPGYQRDVRSCRHVCTVSILFTGGQHKRVKMAARQRPCHTHNELMKSVMTF